MNLVFASIFRTVWVGGIDFAKHLVHNIVDAAALSWGRSLMRRLLWRLPGRRLRPEFREGCIEFMLRTDPIGRRGLEVIYCYRRAMPTFMPTMELSGGIAWTRPDVGRYRWAGQGLG
jgi:hypothetical protein